MKALNILTCFIFLSLIPFICMGQNLKENFHIYLLLGQSNMAGRGKIEDVDTLKHPRVFMLDENSNWVPARNPIHFDKPRIAGTGLGLSFGKKWQNMTQAVR